MDTEQRFAALEARLAKLEGGGLPSVVVNADITGEYGDPEIRKDPTVKYYSGDFSGVGKRMSQCPPDYLDAFAKYKGACAYMGKKEASRLAGSDASESEKKAKYASYDERDGARATAWAAKIRAGEADDDRIPF